MRYSTATIRSIAPTVHTHYVRFSSAFRRPIYYTTSYFKMQVFSFSLTQNLQFNFCQHLSFLHFGSGILPSASTIITSSPIFTIFSHGIIISSHFLNDINPPSSRTTIAVIFPSQTSNITSQTCPIILPSQELTTAFSLKFSVLQSKYFSFYTRKTQNEVGLCGYYSFYLYFF